MTETAVEVEVQVPLSEPNVSDATPAKKPAPEGSQKGAVGKVTTAIASVPYNVDAFVHHLHRCLRTRGGTDTVLLFTAYSARLTGATLDLLGRTALRQSARQLVALAFQLPASTTVVLGTAPAPPLATLAIALAKRIDAFVGMLGEWRTMNRLWGTIAMWLAAKELIVRLRASTKESENGEKPAKLSKFNTTIEILQVIALTTYQIGEASAWFTGKGVFKWSPATAKRFATVSVRSWGAYVFMELFRLLVERQRRVVSQDATAEKEYKDKWFTEFTHSLAWAPLTVHWGYGDGFLPDIAVAALATYPSTALMRNLWKSTA